MSDNKLYATAWIAIALIFAAMASCQSIESYARYKYSRCEATK